MSKCQKCGVELKAGLRFCYECGATVAIVNEPQKETPPIESVEKSCPPSQESKSQDVQPSSGRAENTGIATNADIGSVVGFDMTNLNELLRGVASMVNGSTQNCTSTVSSRTTITVNGKTVFVGNS